MSEGLPKNAKIPPGDPRYRGVVDKQFNKRWTAKPDYVRLAESADDVVSALNDAVAEGRRVVATTGGHCLEGFVTDPDVRVIIDVSRMKRVYYDDRMRAIAVEAGATVGETFRALFDNWRVVVPLGEYPAIGMGGHVVGGAFGFLCRQLGLACDYLHAVEVITVNGAGRAEIVVASRDATDANRELWWAHTGGGGGNFGIVTRYWFRSHDATGDDPATLLPRAPESITTFRAEWDWSDVDEATFGRLLKNHGAWSARNSSPDSPNASLWSVLIAHRQQAGNIIIRCVNTAGADAERQTDDYIAALSEAIMLPRDRQLTRMTWLDFALNPFPDLFTMPPGGVSTKGKDALLRKPLNDRQVMTVHRYMTREDYDVMGGIFGCATYGCRVNTVAPDATASPHRGSIFDAACSVGWMDPAAGDASLAWVRAFYRDLFAESGGVPVPGDRYDGCMINHPDVDLTDSALNTSGTPWHTLYYRQNYPRLQRVKARWDPRNVFHHALSIQAT
jgi:aclacinomycin oxidase